jgi:hypothetical protein
MQWSGDNGRFNKINIIDGQEGLRGEIKVEV